jgi:hypothetical protein
MPSEFRNIATRNANIESKHVSALTVAVVTGCIVPPWRDVKTTNQLIV